MLAHPDSKLSKRKGKNEGGRRVTIKKEPGPRWPEEPGWVHWSLTWRTWILTWEKLDVLSLDFRSSNVRNKDVTAFSFDEVQSLIVL